MKQKDPGGLRIIYVLGLLLAALIASRFLMAFGRVFLLLGSLVLLGAGLYYLVHFIRKTRARRQYEKSPEGVIEGRVDYCLEEIGKNKRAMEDIRQNISDLEEKLRLATQAGEESKQHTRRLIQDFRSELKLREAKIIFLETCIKKLQVILHNYALGKAFAAKKAELQILREQNFEEIAGLEELRSDIEYDRTYLETIDHLSNRLINTQSLETVHALRRELEEMTRSLDEKD